MPSPDHIAIAWLLFGAICICVEAFGVPGIGFLFAGLAAITIGGFLSFDILASESFISQIAWFLILSFAWGILLWKPFKRLQTIRHKAFHSMIGQTATIVKYPLKKHTKGVVKWSGTTLTAQLDDSCKKDTINVGEEVTILAIIGSTVTVTSH